MLSTITDNNRHFNLANKYSNFLFLQKHNLRYSLEHYVNHIIYDVNNVLNTSMFNSFEYTHVQTIMITKSVPKKLYINIWIYQMIAANV